MTVDRVALFVTCVADVLEPEVAAAAVRVLRSTGAEVTCPEGQTCCGQPAWNAGFAEEAATVARTSLDALDADALDAVSGPEGDGPTVVVPAGSCATMIRLYWPHLFEIVGDPDSAARARRVAARVRELTEHLAGASLPPLTASRSCTAVYHRSCHMERELHLHEPPGQVLGRVEGVDVRPWPGDELCCGFGGTFSLRLPEVSVAMADEKLDALPDDVSEIIGADASCLAQLRSRAEARGMGVATRHLAEVVADALPSHEPASAGHEDRDALTPERRPDGDDR